MFSEIEKEYKKGLQERRFFRFYWPKAIIVVLLALFCDFALNLSRWLVYGIMLAVLVVLIIFFFVRDARRGMRRVEPDKLHKKSRRAQYQLYLKADDALRLENLAQDLHKHNIRTKADLELTLNYFERSLPSYSKPNLLEWFLSVAVALASIVVLAYDQDTGAINAQKFLSAFSSTMAVALIILTPAILSKLISTWIASSRTKTDRSLTEDLAFIYVNYEQFRHLLEDR